jgi:hypothetical protein
MGNTLLGEVGWDPYLEDEATLWLLHWLLATNPELATAWYWFFNHFHKPEFSGQEVTAALLGFVMENVQKKTAATTIKGDAAIVLRMYVPSRGVGRIPLEEALDSPLSLLRLVSRLSDNKTYRSRPEVREGLPLGIIGFAVSELFGIKGSSEVTLQDLMYGSKGIPALGSVFRLTENALLTKLEKLLHYIPEVYELRETAGIHQLYKLDDIEPMRYLEKHYNNSHHKATA